MRRAPDFLAVSFLSTLFVVVAAFLPADAVADEWWEAPPILYSESAPDECIAELQERVRSGEWQPDTTDDKSYVRSLLAELGIPVESQVLVFSKTSLQNDRIGPRSPRSIFFTESCYVGWVPGGAIEIASIDAELGPVFWILEPRHQTKWPKFERDRGCLSCHSGAKTGDVPGVLVRSVVPDEDGFPILSERTYVTTHSSPLEERWGGWYVTGTHGGHRHLGNVTSSREGEGAGGMDVEAGANVTSLEGRFPLDRYLAPTSDIVALMVLEHQMAVQNAFTRAQYGAQRAIARERELDRALGRPSSGELSGSSLSAVEQLVEEVVDALLFRGEASLRGGRIEGSDAFQKAFLAKRKESRSGRSLRDFQLRTRLFRYRLSYMIYTESFDALPSAVKDRVWKRLDLILRGEDTSGRYDYLGESERDYIREIVLDTKPEARERWNATDADLAPDRRAESSPSDATPAPSSEDEAR